MEPDIADGNHVRGAPGAPLRLLIYGDYECPYTRQARLRLDHPGRRVALSDGLGMTTISFIGSGRLDRTVARLAVAAGYDLVLSNSCGSQTLEDLERERRLGARADTPTEGAQQDAD